MKKTELTRREFLKTTGKGLSLLALFSGVIRFDTPVRAEGSEERFVNDLIHGEDQLKVTFLEIRDEEKSDAFFIMYLSENGLDIILHDGGMNDNKTYESLLDLRSEILEKAGVPADQADQYKLRLRSVVSHFHADHTYALDRCIMKKKKYFHFSEAYLPPITSLVKGVYNDEMNGDLHERVAYMSVIEAYQPQAKVHVMDYGESIIIPTDIGEVRLFAPPFDWGENDERLRMFEIFYGYKREVFVRPDAIPICVVNANSICMRVALGEHSFLFTGDIEKRIANRTDEPLDVIIAEYGADAFKSDIIKYPHHGQQRNAAARVIQKQLITDKPEAISILTASDGWDQAGHELKKRNMPWMDLRSGSILYTVKDNKISHEVIKNAKSFL